eukprot:gb/GFBE01059208.1/.p1 GENE.gb/GFBE01059208.1/~~gb/GFBE01059208.1/.p1  ORF type:complete len:397 (+),score=64.89 gb/GFBE01059208.1/:1-1191(+)
MVRRFDRVRHISTGRFGCAMLIKEIGGKGQLAAMKTIDIGRLCSQERAILLEEVLSLAKLRHPNLVPVQECFLREGKLCLVMDYLEGGTVAGQIEKAQHSFTGFSRDQVLQWFSEALLGLAYLHGRGIIHRDLRTRRLLLCKAGRVSISSVASSVMLKSGLQPERPDLEAMRYLSPELLSGLEEHSLSSDMWALGVILYEMLALHPPWDHSHPRGLLLSITKQPLKPLPARCPADLLPLCYALLRREPAARTSAADSLRHPTVQARLVSLLEKQEAEPASSFAVPTQNLSNWQSDSRPPGMYSLGHLTLSSMGGTPRALRHAGEVCSQKSGAIVATPRATWNRPCASRVATPSTVMAQSQVLPSNASPERFAEPSLTSQAEIVLNAKSLLEEMPLA